MHEGGIATREMSAVGMMQEVEIDGRRVFLTVGLLGGRGSWIDCVCVSPELAAGLTDAELGATVRVLLAKLPDLIEEQRVLREEYEMACMENERKPMARPVRPSNLYLMRANGIYKIGIGASVENRRKALATASGYAVEVVASWTMESGEYAREMESQWHHFWRKERLGGEWFALTDDNVAFMVNALGTEV